MRQPHAGDHEFTVDYTPGSGEIVGSVKIEKYIGGTAVTGTLLDRGIYRKVVSNAYPLEYQRIKFATNRAERAVRFNASLLFDLPSPTEVF